jgi:Domain of unknown function (DUF4386)
VETDMTTTARPAAARRAGMGFERKSAVVAGVFYLVTFIASMPAAFVFLPPVLDNPDYILSAGADTGVIWGCVLDVINALAGIGTAVALFPVVKRHNEALALGFVATRLLEAAVIMVGVVSLLAVVTLRQDPADATGTDPATARMIGTALVAVRDWTFLLGPGLMPALSALLLGTLMYRSRLVPRVIPTVGLIGAPLLLAGTTATLFGHLEQVAPLAGLAALPVAAWELSLGLYMVVKGFRPSPIIPSITPADAGHAHI